MTAFTPSFAKASEGTFRSARAKNGGGNRVRTGDPELAKLVLYQTELCPRVRSGTVLTVQNSLKETSTSRQKRCDLLSLNQLTSYAKQTLSDLFIDHIPLS